MMSLAGWFEASQLRYMIVAQTLLLGFALCVVLGAFVPRVSRFLATPRGVVAFLALASLALLGSRWPTLFVLYGMNVDESQMVAQSISVPSNPWPWYGFDGFSSGPLNTYLLTVLELIGLPQAFMTARIAALLCEFGGVAAVYFVLSETFSPTVARFGAFAPIVFWAVTLRDHFVHYSSEQFALFLIPATYAIFVRARRHGYAPLWLYACGLCDGALPFAKMQTASIFILSALIVPACVLGATALPWRARLRAIGAFVLGGLTVPALFFAAMLYIGSVRDFWLSYIQTSIAYLVEQTHLFTFLTQTPDFGSYFVTMSIFALLGAICLAFTWRRIPVAERNAFAIAIAIYVAAIYAIYRPGRSSENYLLLGVLPAAALAAAGLAILARTLDIPAVGRRRAALVAIPVLSILLAQNAIARPPYTWLGRDFEIYTWPGPIDDMAVHLDKYMHPGERMAIWGWRPQYFVYSHLRLGTRDSVPEFQHDDLRNPYRAYFRVRYIADFERLHPEGFLDMGPESFDPSGTGKYGHEEFPELAAIVARDYVLKFTITKNRFYIRRDLANRT